MTRESALEAITSETAHRRLAGARFFARAPHSSDTPTLRRVLQAETVSYVRTALQLAISRASDASARTPRSQPTEYSVPDEVTAKLRKEANAHVTRLILHEIATPVGLIASAAAREVPDYRCSMTKRNVENLKRVCHAIEQLRSASVTPRPEEFDLSILVSEIVHAETNDRGICVSLHGGSPLLITSDPALLRLAIANGVRNAVEAVLAASTHDEPHSVVVTWGETDVDCWAAILDRGPGLVGPVESAFETGTTTKNGHTGFGLTIARQAVEALEGSCTLQTNPKGGARFELRWER